MFKCKQEKNGIDICDKESATSKIVTFLIDYGNVNPS